MHTKDIFKHGVVFWLGAVLFLLQSTANADTEATERVEWNKTPIRLTLKVGQERLVHLPGPVKVGLPVSLQSMLRIQSVNGAVYLLAKEPFDTTRVMLRGIDEGQVFLFDLSASKKGGQTNPVQVYLKANDKANPGESSDGDPDTAAGYSYVALTRFAAQQLYAPARLVQDLPGIVRVPLKREPIDLMYGGTVEATPLVAWRAGGLFVTAVKLSNLTKSPQTLDPRNLRGAWLAATFQHNRLLPAGDEADTTAVYLVSARPFEASR